MLHKCVVFIHLVEGLLTYENYFNLFAVSGLSILFQCVAFCRGTPAPPRYHKYTHPLRFLNVSRIMPCHLLDFATAPVPSL